MKIKNNKVLMFSIVLLTFISSNSYADGPRFSRILEYVLIDSCVGNTGNKNEKAPICACALADAQENGWFPDFDNDRDFIEDKDNFMQSYNEQIKHYSDNPNDCEKQ